MNQTPKAHGTPRGLFGAAKWREKKHHTKYFKGILDGFCREVDITLEHFGKIRLHKKVSVKADDDLMILICVNL